MTIVQLPSWWCRFDPGHPLHTKGPGQRPIVSVGVWSLNSGIWLTCHSRAISLPRPGRLAHRLDRLPDVHHWSPRRCLFTRSVSASARVHHRPIPPGHGATMSDWYGRLSPSERADWARFVEASASRDGARLPGSSGDPLYLERREVQFTLPSVKVFGKTVGGFTIGTPDIPYMHPGGTVPGPCSSLVERRSPGRAPGAAFRPRSCLCRHRADRQARPHADRFAADRRGSVRPAGIRTIRAPADRPATAHTPRTPPRSRPAASWSAPRSDRSRSHSGRPGSRCP